MTGPGPLERLASLDPETCETLRGRLRAAGWTLELLGAAESVAPGLPDAVRLPLVESFCARRGGTGTILARLLAYDLAVSAAEAEEALGADLLARLAAAGLLERDGGRVRARLRVLPLDDLYVVCDAPEAGPDAVMGAGPTTYALTRLVPAGAGKVLDLGCGAGALALHAARRGASRSVGVDLNPRAVALARLNARLNGLAAEFRAGDLVAPVGAERFDLVLAQPPYVPLPADVPGATFLHGGARPDELVLRFARAAVEVLGAGGRALLSIETPAGGPALHAALTRSLAEAPVDVVTLSAPATSLDLQAAAYASVADPSLGDRYRAAARRYADHLHGLGGAPVRALVVLRRRADGGRHSVHHPVPALHRLGAADLEGYLAGLDAAAAPEPFLLAAEVAAAPGARIVEEREAVRPEAPPARTARFASPLASDHALSEASAALLEILAAPAPVEAAVRRFAEACGEEPAAVRERVLDFVRQGLLRGIVQVRSIVRARPP